MYASYEVSENEFFTVVSLLLKQWQISDTNFPHFDKATIILWKGTEIDIGNEITNVDRCLNVL